MIASAIAFASWLLRAGRRGNNCTTERFLCREGNFSLICGRCKGRTWYMPINADSKCANDLRGKYTLRLLCFYRIWEGIFPSPFVKKTFGRMVFSTLLQVCPNLPVTDYKFRCPPLKKYTFPTTAYTHSCNFTFTVCSTSECFDTKDLPHSLDKS